MYRGGSEDISSREVEGLEDKVVVVVVFCFFFSSRRRHTRYWRDWSSDVCSSDLYLKHYKVCGEFNQSVERLRCFHEYLRAFGLAKTIFCHAFKKGSLSLFLPPATRFACSHSSNGTPASLQVVSSRNDLNARLLEDTT